MLQRAASNAYSWWWASHIRTKQSKWLEHNLQDMEDRVESMLKVIDQDGDSFAKRAEMYYKKRPELINSVEESYRSYRALAERYDHISRELQSANRTIATVYPEQVQFALDDEDGESFSERSTPSRDPISPNPAVSPQIPKVPKKLYKTPSMFISGKSQPKENTSTSRTIMTSGLSKSEALEELDRIQKQVLVLQTEKEFVKSSYENGITKYYEIENLITEMQEKACSLQDEFGIGTIIEDSEARSLMATTALKSCRETLVQLREKQERTAEEARMAHERIMEAHDSLETLKDEFLQKHSDGQEPAEEQESASTVVKKERRDLEALRQKIKERLEKESGTSFLTVTELTENIDGIVDKVVTLETAVHSQDALVKRLKSETDELQTQVRKLEEEKETLMEDSEIMRNRISELEKELQRVKNLNSTVEDKNDDIETHFTEASCDIDHLSDKLQSAKLDDEVEGTGLFPEVKAVSDADPEKEFEAEEKNAMEADVLPNEEPKKQKKNGEQGTDLDMELQDLGTKEDEPNWQQLFLNGLEDRDKFLMEEYVSILRNFKEVKKRLSEVEEKNRESHFEAAMQIRELKNSNTLKDEEIQSLRQKLSLSQPNPDENQKDEGSTIQRSMDSPANNVFKVIHVDEYRGVPSIEEKFRSGIDDLLEENLEFWLRFSSSFHQMQKFQTSIQDLQGELSKLKEMKNHEGRMSLKSDALPIYKHLREIQTELTLWLEHNSVLNDELQNRFSSLCNIQEEISRVSNVSSISIDPELSNYQAAKFQGEVMNMKQENNKVAQELKASLNRVKSLQAEVQRAMSRLDEDFSLSESKKVKFNKKNSSSGPRIPLRTFLFGVKLKKQKQKPSMFSCMSPALQKQYSDLRSGLPPR